MRPRQREGAKRKRRKRKRAREREMAAAAAERAKQAAAEGLKRKQAAAEERKRKQIARLDRKIARLDRKIEAAAKRGPLPRPKPVARVQDDLKPLAREPAPEGKALGEPKHQRKRPPKRAATAVAKSKGAVAVWPPRWLSSGSWRDQTKFGNWWHGSE